MEEPTAGIATTYTKILDEEQKHGRRYGRRSTSLAFGSGWTALGCIDPIYRYRYIKNKIFIKN